MLPLLSALAIFAAAPPETLVVPLHEIVVIGRRAPEPALTIPAAVSLVSRAQFEATRNISLRDALGAVPGVFVQSRSGAQDVRITIRGFGARGNGERSNAGSMRGIRVLTDGVPLTEPDGRTSLDLADLATVDRIEIARSNASALYGNASGGIVNLRTHLAFDDPFAEYSQRGGSFGFHREQGAAGFALGQGRGVFALANTTFDGWRPHSESSGTIAKLRFTTPVDEKTKLGILLDGVSNLNRFPGPLTQAQLDSAPQQPNPTFVTRNERRRNRVGRAAVTLDRAFSEVQDLSLLIFAEPKVLQRSERNRFRDFTRYHLGGNAAWSMMKKTESGFAFRTRVGVDDAFQDGAILFYDLGPGGVRGTTVIANKREAASSAGGFIQEEVTIHDRWSVRGAARYDNLWYIAHDYGDPTLNATKHFTRVTPTGSISWRGGSHTVYAALGGGVEAPAFNEIDPPPFLSPTALNPFLDAMYSTTYELGARGEKSLSETLGSLRYDAAVYLIDVRNDIVPFNGGAYFFTAGQSRRNGVELGLDWSPMVSFSIGGTANFSDNVYLDYMNDLGNFKDHQIAGLPKSFGTAHARWSQYGLSAELGVDAVGTYFVDDANTAKAKSATLLNGSIGWRGNFGDSSVRLFVAGQNLTDQTYVASVFINGINGQFFEAGLPRNGSAGLTVSFR